MLEGKYKCVDGPLLDPRAWVWEALHYTNAVFDELEFGLLEPVQNEMHNFSYQGFQI